MNLTVKRILVIFSITLNIGFVIMALILFYNHPRAHHPNKKMRLEILSHLDLPADVEKSVAKSMEKMESSHMNFINRLHQVRNEAITLLSQPKPVNKKRFEVLNDKINDLTIQQNHVLQEHLIEIRNQMGDEKGARFFSEMLKQVEKRGLKEP